jgi:hypothetical protein
MATADADGNAASPPATAETGNAPIELDVLSEQGSGYDPRNAYALMRLCDLAYRQESEVAADLGQRGIDPVAGHYKAFSNTTTKTFAYYVEAHGAAFVVFRGTDPSSWQNLAEDADVSAGPDIAGEVHQGFQLVLDGVWSELDSYVRERQADTGLPLYVAGHSLGAAAATIATARWLLDPVAPIWVAATYAIGSPRVGNGDFANTLANVMSDDGTYFARVVNQCDPVTNVPVRAGPPLYIPFYEHVSYGTNENDFVEWIEGPHQVATSIPLAACPPAGFDLQIGEHMPDIYVSQLGAQL